MNKELLLQVKEAILTEPKQFVMDSVFATANEYSIKTEIPNCGTAACIAGWALAIHSNLNPKEARAKVGSSMALAQNILGIDPNQADHLFLAHMWPTEFREEFYDSNWMSKERAEVAAKRIDHFIATGE